MTLLQLQSDLQTQWMGRHLQHFETLPSTNGYLKTHADSLPKGALVIADAQSEGYGSKSREWHSPTGGLYFSLLLPWRSDPLISLAFSVASAQALLAFGAQVSLKWPNDLVWDHRKLGGILLEGRAGSWIVAGLGLNLLPCGVPDSSSLAETGFDVQAGALIATLLNIFERLYEAQPRIILREWERLAGMLGQAIHVSTPHGFIDGVALGLDPQGGLMIKTSDGLVQTVYNGTLRLFDGRYA